MVENRAYPRYPLSLDVAVTLAGRQSFFCIARDYCFGGMYLMFNTQFAPGTPAAGQLRKGDQLVIDFTSPLDASAGSFRLQGEVAHAEDVGFGVQFTQQNIQALQALQQLSGQDAGEPQGAVAVDKGQYAELVTRLQGRIGEFAKSFIGQTMDEAHDALFNAADKAGSNKEQVAFFDLITAFKERRKGIIEGFIESVIERSRSLSEAIEFKAIEKPREEKAKLSLVDKDEFSDWLIGTTIITRLESHFSDPLYALEKRLDVISVSPINKQNDPVGPYILCHAFQDAVRELTFGKAQGELIYRVFERELKKALEDLYDELNNSLIEADIIPDISEEYEFVAPSSSSGHTAEADTGQSEIAAGEQLQPEAESGSAATPAADTAPRAAAQPAPATAPVSPQQGQTVPAIPGAAGSAQAGPPPAAPAAGGTATATAGTGAAPARVSGHGFNSISGLMSISRHAPQPGSQAPQGTAVSPGQPVSYYQPTDILQSINWLAQQHQSIGDLREQGSDVLSSVSEHLQQHAADDENEWQLDEQQSESLQFVENLLGYFRDDLLISDLSKKWVSRLEIPLLKASILDEDILHDTEHPAHQLINRIDQLGSTVPPGDKEREQELEHLVDGMIKRIDAEVEENPRVFSEVLGELDQQQAEQLAAYDHNVAEVLKECETKQKMNHARSDLVEDLNLRIGDREVPRILLALLDSGWKNLLLSTYVHKGPESELYQKHLDVIDQLYARLSGKPPFNSDVSLKDDAMYQWVAQVLGKVAKDKHRAKQLLSTLKYLFNTKTEEVQSIKVPRLSSEVFQPKKEKSAHKPKELSDTEWYNWLDRADTLSKNDLVKYRDPEGNERVLKLLWLDKAFSNYVFVSQAGNKVLDTTIDELANHLYRNTLTKVDEWDTPIMERATFSLLDKLHKEFSERASMDELTGLLNRRAFERYLTKLLEKTKTDQSKHIFSFFDIDRFNIINNTCGFESGDTLLLQFATILKDTFGEKTSIARMGDDEFGVMMEDTSRSKGYELTSKVLDTLHGFAFSCEEKDFAITSSIGLVELSEATESTNNLMSAAESACFAAKEAGRDTIQIYSAENKQLDHRQKLMEWVGRINKLFDAGLIKLRCQKIAPLKERVHSLPHYEILLDVYDQEGNHVPLEEFIMAAEQYNRILDIDNFVVGQVFSWIEEHYSIIKNKFNGFSINLSGRSLNDRKFMDTLHGRMKDISFPADLVTFEITETLAIKNLDNASRFMSRLKETGCRFSLDDFGSGVSSYSYLKSLPVDYLKIDGIFVKDLATSTNDYAVIKSINEISHVMGKQTVAEYAVDEVVVQILRDIGIDYAQGFGVEKPRPLDSLVGK